jgi:hypothetical protein
MMDMLRHIFAACAVAAAAWPAAAFDISVPPDPAPSVAFAAEELSEYVGRITGKRPAVTTNAAPDRGIALSIDPAADDDSFDFRSNGKMLSVAGGKRGVLYGVYELLERFGGVEWLASWRTVVPKGTFEIPRNLNEHHEPAFALRELLTSDATTNIPFAVHLRLNGLRSHDSTKPFPVDPKYGGKAWRFVKGLKNCHTHTFLMPTGEFFKEHPEYYAEVDGIRRDVTWQLCLTHPDVLRIVTKRVLEHLEADPSAKMVGVSHNDARNNYCRCPRCAAVDEYEESHAGTELRFVNAIADEVKKRFPDVYVQTLAYQYTRKPPKHEKPRDNVVITLCSIECDRLRPFGSERSTEVNKSFVDDLLGWSRLTDKLYVWDYTGENLHYIYPMPNAPVVYDNIRFFHDHNVKFMFSEGNGHRAMHTEFGELKCWLIAKAMWNPCQPLEPLMDRFFKGYYGKAAPIVREYYEKEKAQAASMPADMKLNIYQFDSKKLYPDAYIAESLALWDRAEEAVKDDPETLYNVRMGKASVLRLALDRICSAPKWVWATRHPERFPPPDPRAAVYEKFLLDRVAEAKARGQEMRFGNTPQRQKRALAAWRRYNAMQAPKVPVPQARVGVDDMQLAELTFGAVVKHPDAFGGKAIEINNRYEEEAAYLDFKNVGYDTGADYRVRVHMKIDLLENGKGEAAVVRVGKQEIHLDAKDVKPGWTWHEFKPFRPKPWDRIAVRPGHRVKDAGGRMAISRILVDEFQITEL